jgi:hypothetical protein
MKISPLILLMILAAALSPSSMSAQQKAKLGENSALRYWSAFAQMQDAAITSQQVKELGTILDGTTPYDDLKFKDLVEKNKPALVTMTRGTALANCDWGLDYGQGPDTPIDYAPRALAMARLNVLYALHLQIVGDKEGSIRALAAGMHFSRDIANGGSLFATLLAKDALIEDFRAIAFILHTGGLTALQRATLQKALAQLGPDPLDWQSAIRREMVVLNRPPWQDSVSLNRVTQAYVAALNDPSTLPKLEDVIASTPQPLRDVIPLPKEVLEQKQDFTDKLREIRSRQQ